MLNTHRTRMPKGKSSHHGGNVVNDVSPSGNIRYGIRGYEERVIGHDVSYEYEFSSDFSRRKWARVTHTHTCAAIHARRANAGVAGTRKIYNVSNKILVKPLRRSVNRLFAPSARQYRRIQSFVRLFVRSTHKHDFDGKT